MKAIIACCLLGVAIADLRLASQPKQGYDLKQQGGGRGSENFVVGTGRNLDGTLNTQTKGIVPYIEPAAHGYQGLVQQRKNNYDNFLRSNIDNEQDNRNFNAEDGVDMLPFRSYKSGVPLTYPYQGNAPNGADDSLQNVNQNNQLEQVILRVKPGEPTVTPLRWNNPHAAEIEVNLWLMNSNPPTIVPIKKPACSGEGNQNNIIEWAIPADFNQINWANCPATANVQGCTQPGDCVLQIYAHSVETRQYATAFSIIIEGNAVPANQQLPYNAQALDHDEKLAFLWPTSVDLKAMVTGDPPGDPKNQNAGGSTNTGTQATLANVKICASSEREGVKTSGETVTQFPLGVTVQNAPQVTSNNIHLYVCKNSELEIAAEQLIDKVEFSVLSSADGLQAFSPITDGTRTENYTPFEMLSETHFGGDGIKQITATVSGYSGQPVTVTGYIDTRGNAKRWRFRRHLKDACQNTPSIPFADPWMDLSKLERETCRSAQDPNANYATTTTQYAVLHSDVANHAYQNSDYSPYSGQQHGLISRNLQAAAVVHMTSGNRGELGKANIPNAVKAKVAQLNNAVNNIYQNYEKVANKVIDELTNNGGKNGAGTNLGVQPLGESFRSAEKGATSTKRLKTTTYVPSFDTQGYNPNVIAQAIQSRTQGNKAKYADLLSDPKPNTGRQYIEIYPATMNQMLPAFKNAATLGITYMPSIQLMSCQRLQVENPELWKVSQSTNGNTQPGIACCEGPVTGDCGKGAKDAKNFIKRNAAGNKDGGLYAAKTFTEQRYRTMYGCESACLNVQQSSRNLAKPVTKTAKGTCIGFLAGSQGCVDQKPAAGESIDCTACTAIFNNVAPVQFVNKFKSGPESIPILEAMSASIISESALPEEQPGNAPKVSGGDLVADNTAICHTESEFKCEQGGQNVLATNDYISLADYNQMVAQGCSQTESVKIADMCDDGPCDNDSESLTCLRAKQKCQVDPDSGVYCMPGTENDPCINCKCQGSSCDSKVYVDSGKVVSIAFTSVLVFLAAVL